MGDVDGSVGGYRALRHSKQTVTSYSEEEITDHYKDIHTPINSVTEIVQRESTCVSPYTIYSSNVSIPLDTLLTWRLRLWTSVWQTVQCSAVTSSQIFHLPGCLHCRYRVAVPDCFPAGYFLFCLACEILLNTINLFLLSSSWSLSATTYTWVHHLICWLH